MIPRWLPHLALEGLSRYFRLEIQGVENIPKRGACIIAANHSGFAGLDALLLYHSIKKFRKRLPKTLAHKLWFRSAMTKQLMLRFGFHEAKMGTGVQLLKRNSALIVFPEGESGNFKPSVQMYQLQPFRSGLVRLALESGAPIIPVLITGAEEANITIKQLKLPKLFNRMLLPLPLNVVPLPTKWSIYVLPRIDLPYERAKGDDHNLVREITEDIQDQMQDALLDIFLKKREGVK